MVIQTYSEAFFMKNKKKGDGGRTPRALLPATLSHMAIFIIAVFIGSAILFMQPNPTALVGAASLSAFIVSGAISGFLNSRMLGRGGFAISSASALIFTLILFIISAVSSGGKIPSRALMNYLCYLPTAVLFAFIATRRRENRKRRRRR